MYYTYTLIIYTAAEDSSSSKKKKKKKKVPATKSATTKKIAKKKAPARKKKKKEDDISSGEEPEWDTSQEESDESESEEEEESDDSGKERGGYSSAEEDDDDDDVLTTPEQLKKGVEVWVKCSGDPKHKEWEGVVCADATPEGVYIKLDAEKKPPTLVPIKDVSLMFPPKNAKQRGERSSTTTTPRKVAPKVSREITPTKEYESECEYCILCILA